MERCWRWFGPEDRISLRQVREAGATGVVTALHGNYRGHAWNEAEVAARRDVIEAAGLRWSVVESIPVTSAIKRRRGPWRADVDAFLASLRAVAAAGVRTVCYNFMPVVDWTRTELAYPLENGALAVRFDPVALAAFDVHVLRRPAASGDYDETTLLAAERFYAGLDEAAIERLSRTLTMGLPGADGGHDLSDFAQRLAEYRDIDAEALRANLTAFLSDAAPEAERLGVRLCLHPDDPPRPVFGIPRVVSTLTDYRHILGAVDTSANGVTFCAGSLGAREDADVPAMARELAPRTHFLHLRRVALEGGGAFHETDHAGA
ncbi:MAG: mannonate dehydratase, partial [Pseudomonadota bacterium]